MYTYSRNFPNQDALKDYLQEHPGADKSVHHVDQKAVTKPHDPRDYARERAKFAPPKKNQLFSGPPEMHSASLAQKVAARWCSASEDGDLRNEQAVDQ